MVKDFFFSLLLTNVIAQSTAPAGSLIQQEGGGIYRQPVLFTLVRASPRDRFGDRTAHALTSFREEEPLDEEFSKRRLQIATYAAKLVFFRTGSLVFSPLP